MKKYTLAIAALLALGTAQTATAEVSVGISIGIPGIIYSEPGYWYPPPPPPRAYYAPPAVVIAPAPGYYRWGHVERARYDRPRHYRGYKGHYKGKHGWHHGPGKHRGHHR